MVQKEDEQGMASPPYEASKDIEKILNLELPCELDLEREVLCDECPYDIIPKTSCGLIVLQDRAKKLRKEID